MVSVDGDLERKACIAQVFLFACVDALRLSQQFFSHVGTIPGFNLY